MQVLHIFKYLGINKDRDLEFNPELSELSGPFTINSKITQIKKMYPGAVKYFPQNAPSPIVNPIPVSCFVENDHVGDKITRSSQSVIILYCNKAPIVW